MSARERGENGKCTGNDGRRGQGRGAGRVRMPAMRRRGPHVVGRARHYRCGEREKG